MQPSCKAAPPSPRNPALRSCLALLAAIASAPPLAAQDYVLVMAYERSTSGAEGEGSSSASGNQAIGERVLAETPRGTEVEYAIPGDPEAVRGNERWMFPARVLVTPDGGKTLLNEGELAKRNAAWLAEAGWTREMCSRWIFTWTALQIRCDPAAALEAIEDFGMRPGKVSQGQPFTTQGVLGALAMTSGAEREGRAVLTGSGPVDPDFLRKQAASAALAIGEISRRPVTPAAAEAEAAGIAAEGTVSVTLEVDAAGMVWRREQVSDYRLTGARHGNGRHRARVTVTRLTRADWERERQHDGAAAAR